VSTLDRLIATRKSGGELFRSETAKHPYTLLDFWAWSTSDLVSNTTRGVLAEFIVAMALGIDMRSAIRDEWAGWDLTTPEGIKIEVKASARVQSWFQKTLSNALFSIKEAKLWNADANKYGETAARHADVYVFAFLFHEEKHTVDPLDMHQWEFWVAPTSAINERLASRKSVNQKMLDQPCGKRVRYDDLRAAVMLVAGGS